MMLIWILVCPLASTTLSPNDIWNNEAQGVPGIIVGAGLVRGFNGYGPKSGFWRQPLPKRCEK
jgi:hypothetical protein